MKQRATLSRYLALPAVLALFVPAAFGDDDGEALNRSFYVPVEFRLCEHLEDAVLYRDEEPVAHLPGTHVFQFTFYPALKRLEPEWERVRVEGTHDGEPFRTEVVVTPSSVYIGNKKIDLQTDARIARLRHRIDIRHETVTLSLRCAASCARTKAGGADETR